MNTTITYLYNLIHLLNIMIEYNNDNNTFNVFIIIFYLIIINGVNIIQIYYIIKLNMVIW